MNMMQRREFVKQSCVACFSGTLIPTLLAGCQATNYTSGIMEPNGLTVSKDEFIVVKKKGRQERRPFIIVANEKLQFPIYVYRFSEDEYSALWMQCSHQGSELQAAGDHLHCPSHGSEFNNKGINTQGPAELNLRTFPVVASTNNIFIDLRSS